MLLCTKCTIVIMWFSGPFRHQVFLKSYVEEEILPPWAIQQIPQETLDEHVARPVERIAYTPCVCLLQLAISDQARGFSIGRRYRKCDDFNLLYGNGKNGADSDLITYVDQFILGLNKFKGL